MNSPQFIGVQNLYGQPTFEKFKNSHIAIIGIGGVGSWAAEALARSNIGHLTLVDLDDVCESNINRQIHALYSSISKSKTQLMLQRIHDIQPDCEVRVIDDFFRKDTCEAILEPSFDFVIDAIDSVSNKCLLISSCVNKNIQIISVGAAGGKKDISSIMIDDLARSYNDNLLERVRKKLRKEHEFPRGTKKKFHVPCIFSNEIANSFNKDSCQGRVDCATGPGTICHMTSTFGLYAASYVLNHIHAKIQSCT